jgi:hypothetical protein
MRGDVSESIPPPDPTETNPMSEKPKSSPGTLSIEMSVLPWYKNESSAFAAFWWANTCALFWYGILVGLSVNGWFAVLALFMVSWIVTLTIVTTKDESGSYND